MQKSAWLLSLLALFLTATLIWAEGSYAQAQGGPRRAVADQGTEPAWGAGNPNCPNSPGTQTGTRSGGGKAQTRSRKRSRGNVPQASPQLSPQSPTPSSPSGN